MDSTRLSLLAFALLSCILLISAATPTTTPAAGPTATWSVDGPNGIRCVLASFNMTFNVTYNATRPTGDTFDQHAYLTVPQTASVNQTASFCAAGTVGMYNMMSLYWKNGSYNYGLELTFNMTGGTDNRTTLSGITLMYDLGDASVFPSATSVSGEWQRNAYTNGTVAGISISHGNYLKCDSGFPAYLTESMEKKPLIASIENVKLEAFRTVQTNTFDDKEDVCPGDQVTSTTMMPTTAPTTLAPDVASYNVTDPITGQTCLYAVFGMNLDVLYYNTTGHVVNATLNDLNNATVNHTLSYCHNDTAMLVLQDFLKDWELHFNFTHTKDQFSLDNVILKFNVSSPNFVNPNYTLTQISDTKGLPSNWAAHLGRSYMCKMPSKWELDMTGVQGIKSIDLRLEKVRVEAFMVNGTLGQEEECAADNGGGGGDTSEIVPIAVGCALAALVIIVLIAYVIGRRRNRARGYESM